MLKDIERHVAWFYLAAVRADTKAASFPRSDDRFLRRVLRTTEAFTSALPRLHHAKPHPDDLLDLAVILSRALEYWNRARVRWQSDPASTALAVAANELADATEALQDAIAAAPWFGDTTPPDKAATGTFPRKVQ